MKFTGTFVAKPQLINSSAMARAWLVRISSSMRPARWRSGRRGADLLIWRLVRGYIPWCLVWSLLGPEQQSTLTIQYGGVWCNLRRFCDITACHIDIMNQGAALA